MREGPGPLDLDQPGASGEIERTWGDEIRARIKAVEYERAVISCRTTLNLESIWALLVIQKGRIRHPYPRNVNSLKATPDWAKPLVEAAIGLRLT